VAGKPYAGRGKRLDADIEYMQRAWRGELVEGATKKLTPTPTNGRSVPHGLRGPCVGCLRTGRPATPQS
jgi:hypothetical protein